LDGIPDAPYPQVASGGYLQIIVNFLHCWETEMPDWPRFRWFNRHPWMILSLLAVTGCAIAPGVSSNAPIPGSSDLSPGGLPPAITPSPEASTVADPAVDPWQTALERGQSAATLAASARSKDDWLLVVSRWQQAIELLGDVPASHPNYAQVQAKIAEYQQNLASAQQQADVPIPAATNPTSVVRSGSDSTSDSGVAASSAESLGEAPPDPTSTTDQVAASSSSDVIALAEHLQQVGATMYGTYWCPYCNRQRELFGADALSILPQVECDARGTNPQPDRCRDANINSYPTWEINGELYPGLRSLDELADLSGYTGSREF
jgi:hypothetical protein